jgi:hypothetical protein
VCARVQLLLLRLLLPLRGRGRRGRGRCHAQRVELAELLLLHADGVVLGADAHVRVALNTHIPRAPFREQLDHRAEDGHPVDLDDAVADGELALRGDDAVRVDGGDEAVRVDRAAQPMQPPDQLSLDQHGACARTEVGRGKAS